MTKKMKTVFLLVGTISLVLVIVIVAGWFVYGKKNSPNEAKTSPALDLNKTKSYPKLETFNVPILMYHYIRIADPDDTLGLALSVTPSNFESQVNWLKQNNYETVKLSDLADTERTALSKAVGEGKRPVVITFDDGYEDAYTNAFPVLKKYGFTATLFIIRNFTDKKPEYLTSAQIAELDKANMEIGSHTLSHLDLTALDTANLHKQIDDSKVDALVFCYPAGKYDTQVEDVVKEANYVAAVTTKPGVATEKSDLFALPRVRIEDISIEAFAKKFQ